MSNRLQSTADLAGSGLNSSAAAYCLQLLLLPVRLWAGGGSTQTVSHDVEHTQVSLFLGTNKRFPKKTDSCATCRLPLYHFQEGSVLFSQLAWNDTLFSPCQDDMYFRASILPILNCLWWTWLLYINTKNENIFQKKALGLFFSFLEMFSTVF